MKVSAFVRIRHIHVIYHSVITENLFDKFS